MNTTSKPKYKIGDVLYFVFPDDDCIKYRFKIVDIKDGEYYWELCSDKTKRGHNYINIIEGEKYHLDTDYIINNKLEKICNTK
jgi:hypothetical protein